MTHPKINPSIMGSPKIPKYFLASFTLKSSLFTPGIRSKIQFKGAAIITLDKADMVGSETPGIPKKSSTRGAVQSDNLKETTAITMDAETPKNTFFVT